MNWAEPLNTIAAPLMIDNIDTDQIIPSREMKTISKKGLKSGLFANWQYLYSEGKKIGLNNDFILNKNEFRHTEILISGKNFGCGSSREHAPWALEDYGFNVIIAPSYADIFYNNCFKNGILPVILEEHEVEELFTDLENHDDFKVDVDLVSQSINTDSGKLYRFELDEFRKGCLINGLDEIGLTLKYSDLIRSYEERRERKHPWVFGAIA